MAFGTPTNPFSVKVTATMVGGIGVKTYLLQTGPLAAGAEISLFGGATLGGIAATTKHTTIIELEISMDHDSNLRLKFQPRAQGATAAVLHNMMYNNGSGYTVFTVAALRANKSSIFKLWVDYPTASTPTVNTPTNIS